MAGEISFRPTIDDYVAANRAWFWRAVRAPRFVVTLLVGAGVIAVIGAILWDGWDATTVAIAIGRMMLGYLLLITVVMGSSYLFQPVSARRLFRQQRTLDRDFVFAWDGDGTRFTSDIGYSATPWHAYHGWYDGRRVLLLMLNDRLFHFIPHRVLDAGQLADLRQLALRAGEAQP